jgi:hypothetical protein
MFRRLILVGLLFALTGCSRLGNNNDNAGLREQISSGSQSAEQIARNAAAGVGTITLSSSGTTGIPVIVLEERHNSRVGQLQHTITLVRLHDKYGLKEIVLEGYLKERPPIDTAWFIKAVREKAPEARARVAVQFLKQGEISAAEFMKLVYSDIALLPSETEATYNATLPDSTPPIDYLNKIAVIDRSWAKERGKPYESSEGILSLTGDEHLRLAKEIKQYAEENSVPITPQEKKAMEQFIEFWEKRMASNTTITDAVAGVPQAQGLSVIAANVGAFHTQGVCELLKKANRPYAAIKPLYTAKDLSHPKGENQGDLTDVMFDRKNKKLPVFSQGLSSMIFSEVRASKKPEPILEEPFFKAESWLYGSVTSIANVILGSADPPGPPNGGKPPFGFSDNDFDGEFMKIVPADIQYFPAQNDRRKAILIPVIFKRSGAKVWVGAVRARGLEEKGQETVEAIVASALQEVQAEKETPDRAEDRTGQIQMDTNTFTIVGEDPAVVNRALMSIL